MIRYRNILLCTLSSVFCTLSSVLCTPILAQDYARLGERTIMGTARYVGMGGAMTAIGGDPSAAQDNPAGLGLYRRSEVLLTFDESLDRAQVANSNYSDYSPLFMVPQASVEISLPTYKESDRGMQFNNILFSYQRLRSYSRSMFATAQQETPSLGHLLEQTLVEPLDIPFCANPYSASNGLQIRESGYINQFSVDWAMNISNQWFVGAGIRFLSSNFSSNATYTEIFNEVNPSGQHMTNRNISTLFITGASVAGSVGLIYRPLGWLRLGFGLQTASVGAIRTYTTGTLSSLTDSLRVSDAPDDSYSDKNFHHPWHTSTSVAFQIGAWAMIALQYDYYHQKDEPDLHSLRAGFEVIPILGMYINGGYAYESTFRDNMRPVAIDDVFIRQDTYFQHPMKKGAHYASIAMGYRGSHVLAQVAYQYRCQAFRLWPLPTAEPYTVDTDTHRIVVTIGWHRYY